MGTLINGAAAEGFSPISEQRHTLRLWSTTRGSGRRKEKRVSAGESQQAFQSSSSSPCHGSLSAGNKGTPGNGPRWRSVGLCCERVTMQTEVGGHRGSPGLVAVACWCLKALCAQLSSHSSPKGSHGAGLLLCSSRPHTGWGMPPSHQPELMQGATGPLPAATSVPTCRVPWMQQAAGLHPSSHITQLRPGCTPHPPLLPPPSPGLLSPGQHCTPAPGRGRKTRGELHNSPPSAMGSCSVPLQTP